MTRSSLAFRPVSVTVTRLPGRTVNLYQRAWPFLKIDWLADALPGGVPASPSRSARVQASLAAETSAHWESSEVLPPWSQSSPVAVAVIALPSAAAAATAVEKVALPFWSVVTATE